ncbi:hypothetical protein CWE08_06205 [Aliidiomarina iranensis]|uniref:Bacteriophage CI repressor N-terminal domain-containing protein n=1 Tax=Aliidiomarina iranensis TaxID=1434071 RepID=A0A432VWZ0_9GAMM|nr:helix-turn-helix domain-containing protein [Aliidiomarina iranensis]RUO21177.1 hypothetical protein CWE08_06205 [Aliidiomarina iranensis]
MSKSKDIGLTIEQVLQYARVASGLTRDVDVANWLGLGKSALNNWRTRGTIPYKTLIPILLEKGISLDWFFASGKHLRVPETLLTHHLGKDLEERSIAYKGEPIQLSKVAETLQYIQAIFARHGVEANEANMQLFLTVYESLSIEPELRAVTLERMAATLEAHSES